MNNALVTAVRRASPSDGKEHKFNHVDAGKSALLMAGERVQVLEK